MKKFRINYDFLKNCEWFVFDFYVQGEILEISTDLTYSRDYFSFMSPSDYEGLQNCLLTGENFALIFDNVIYELFDYVQNYDIVFDIWTFSDFTISVKFYD